MQLLTCASGTMLRGRQPAPLTEAARDVLEEVVAGLRDEILASAWRSAAEPYGEAREIAVNDILRAVDEMRRPPSRLRSPVERLLLFYALTGILTAIAGLVYLVAVRFLPNLSGGQLVAALATLAGTAIGAVSSLLAATRTRRGRGVSEWHAPEPTSPREFGTTLFLSEWLQIELALRDAAVRTFGDAAAAEPLSNTIRGLREAGKISERDEDELKRLLRLRNQVVHEGIRLSEADLESAAATAERLVQRLAA